MAQDILEPITLTRNNLYLVSPQISVYQMSPVFGLFSLTILTDDIPYFRRYLNDVE